MIRFLRSSRRPVVAAATLTLALVATLAIPASAGFAGVGPDDSPMQGTHPVRDAVTNILGRPMDLPDVDTAVRLHCAPRATDRAAEAHVAAVACEWSSGDDLNIRSWQLWNLQIRPERGGRNLVTEVGAETTSHVDTEVVAPAAYLYAVLGLDSDGEVVARSRIQMVKLEQRDRAVEPMRLECEAHRSVTDRAPAVSVGCGWSEITNDAAVGYVIWKSVDGGERTALARVGLDTTDIRDDEVAFGHRYTYEVTAVDGGSHVVGRSRAETVSISDHDRATDHPVDRPTDRPTDRSADHPADLAPADVAPVDVAPADAVRGTRAGAD